MPPRNVPLPNAVNLFNCNICDKGYPRQVDYENHLRSYDHNHRQRLADMKKLTAANEGERPNKGPLDMRNISTEDSSKKPGLGPRFKKVGGAGAAAGGGRFKKVGVAVSGSTNSYDSKGASDPVKEDPVKSTEVVNTSKADATLSAAGIRAPATEVAPENQAGLKKDEDVVMGEGEEEDLITWEEYDFTKPTDCDHANCPGCKQTIDGIYEDGWLVLGSA